MQLIHGDCLEKMKDIPDKSIDMVLCDLPYGTTACKWDVVIPFEPLWEQYKRIIKDFGAVVLFGSEPFSSYLRMSNIKQYKYDWVWIKNKAVNFFNVKKMPLKSIENILVFYKKTPVYNPQGVVYVDKTIKNPIGHGVKGKHLSGHNGGIVVGEYRRTTENYPRQEIKFNVVARPSHPTQKPVALLEYLIKTYTIEGETVLDNCMGSGSTGIACINTRRKFIGIEKDDKYFEIAKKRIQEHEDEDIFKDC